MNLQRIVDTIAVKKSEQLYKLLPSIDKRNFFFVLASKIVPHLLNRRAKKGESNMTISPDINGNKVVFSYPKLSLTVNGVKIPAKGEGMKWFSDAVHKIFAMETKGELKINRPEGFTRKKERLQFKSAEGTVFTTMVNSVAYATGELDLSVKGTASNKLFLTETQYNQVKNKDKFEEHDNGVQKYYIRKGTKFIDITKTGKPATRAIHALQFFDRANQIEFLEEAGLSEIITNPDVTDPTYVVVDGDEVFICTAHEGRQPTIKKVIVHKKEIKHQELSEDAAESLEREYQEFKRWCKNTGKPVNAKSYEEFAETA